MILVLDNDVKIVRNSTKWLPLILLPIFNTSYKFLFPFCPLHVFTISKCIFSLLFRFRTRVATL